MNAGLCLIGILIIVVLLYGVWCLCKISSDMDRGEEERELLRRLEEECKPRIVDNR